MKPTGLALVAYTENGSASHPVTSFEDVTRVFGWLSPLLPGAVWTVEEPS